MNIFVIKKCQNEFLFPYPIVFLFVTRGHSVIKL